MRKCLRSCDLFVQKGKNKKCVFDSVCRPVIVGDRSLLFEHYLHPCLSRNSTIISISRFLLPFGLQGFELIVNITWLVQTISLFYLFLAFMHVTLHNNDLHVDNWLGILRQDFLVRDLIDKVKLVWLCPVFFFHVYLIVGLMHMQILALKAGTSLCSANRRQNHR